MTWVQLLVSGIIVGISFVLLSVGGRYISDYILGKTDLKNEIRKKYVAGLFMCAFAITGLITVIPYVLRNL